MKVAAVAGIFVVLASPALSATAARPTIIVQPVPVTVRVEPPKAEAKLAWSNDPVWITAIATIALAVVTALLWLFTGFMWWEARKSSQATAEALRIARDAYTAEHKPNLFVTLSFPVDDDEGETLAVWQRLCDLVA